MANWRRPGWVVQHRGEMALGIGDAVREYLLATGPCDHVVASLDQHYRADDRSLANNGYKTERASSASLL